MNTRYLVSAAFLAAALAASARAAAPVIYTTTSNLLPNTPNQPLQIYVSGTDLIQGESLNFYIDTGSSGPIFTGLDILAGTIFAANNTGLTHPNDPGFNAFGIYTASAYSSHLACVSTTTATSSGVTDAGLLATLWITTTATSGGTFVLNMVNTPNGGSNFPLGGLGGATLGLSQPHIQFSVGTAVRQWKLNTGGSWGTDSNWTPFAPYAQGDVANFLGTVPAGVTATITLYGAQIAGTINFNDAAATYDLEPGVGGVLQLNNGTQSAVIADLAGAHTIGAPLTLLSNASVSVAGGSTLTAGGGISGNAYALSLSGPGTLLLTGLNTYGATNIAAGSTLQVGNGTVSGTLGTGAITNAGLLTLANLAMPIAVPMSGPGSVSITSYIQVTSVLSNNFGITSTGTLQIGNGGTVGLLSGSNVINGGILAFDRSDAVTQGAFVTGTGTLTQMGTGTTTLATAANYSGPTIISAGKLSFSGGVSHSIGSVSGTGTLFVDANTTLTSDGVNLLNGTWIINGTQVIRSSSGGGAYANHYLGQDSTVLSGTSVTSNLTFGTGAKLDLRNNALIVQATPATLTSMLGQVAFDVTQGYITSSTAAANPAYSLVVAVDNANINATMFGGVPVNSDSIIVTEALTGDANLDGFVDLNDFNIWLSNLGNANSANSASTGDLNADGFVDLNDFNLWLSNLGQNVGVNPAPSLAAGGGLSSGVAAAPEPATFGVMASGAVWLVSRRRKKSMGR